MGIKWYLKYAWCRLNILVLTPLVWLQTKYDVYKEWRFAMAVDSVRTKTVEQGKVLKMPKGINQRKVEVDFLQSRRTDEIISQMYEDFEFSGDAVADSSTFFERVRKDDRYVDLYNFMHE